MALTEDMEQYAEQIIPAAKQFLRELAVIPAPSHHEEKRVAYVKAWMEKNGAQGVYVDPALNVIWPVQNDGVSELTAIMAHTDVVFPDTEPLPLKEDGNIWACPGIGDDTMRLTLLLHAVKYYTDRGRKPKKDLLVVANSCEEGLGNLKGSLRITDDFAGRLKELITIDGGPKALITRGVGSERYRVTVRTEGGHSYSAFGNKNAIAWLAGIIDTLYRVKVPVKAGCKTTYNVGEISGGTSVNTIAQNASMLYEYRSDDRECLAFMRNMFEKTIDAFRAAGLDIEVELLGERPCNGDVKEPEFTELKNRVKAAQMEIYGLDNPEGSGSTDANYPLSKGIPAVCIGAGVGRKAHTREENVDVSTMQQGLRFLMRVLQDYFE